MGSLWWIWLIPALGVGLLAAAAWQWAAANRFRATAQPANGEVVGYYEYDSTDNDGVTTHYYDPEVRFMAADGTQVEQRSGMGSYPRPYTLGVQLRVIYDPANPADYRIDTPFRIYFVAGILGLIGLVFTVVGVLVAVHVSAGKH